MAQRHRRAGVGAALMRSALAEVTKAGCYKMQLHSGNQRSGAHAFYRAFGMEAVAEGFKIYFSASGQSPAAGLARAALSTWPLD